MKLKAVEKITNTFVTTHNFDAPDFRPVIIKDINWMSGAKKDRLIHVPNESMAFLHQKFVKQLRSRTKNTMPSACGGMKKQSVLTTLDKHRDQSGKFNRYIYALDLSKAYHQVRIDWLAKILLKLDGDFFLSEEYLYGFLLRYCTKGETPGLVMGGGSSPDLFNYYCEYMIDRFLREFTSKNAITYTRYIDDLLFSSDKPIGRKKRQAIREIILNAKLVIQERKSHVYDLQKNPVSINGVVLHSDGKISVPRRYMTRIQGIIHRGIHYGDVSFLRIQGMVNVVRMISKGRPQTITEQKLLYAFEKLKDSTLSLFPQTA